MGLEKTAEHMYLTRVPPLRVAHYPRRGHGGRRRNVGWDPRASTAWGVVQTMVRILPMVSECSEGGGATMWARTDTLWPDQNPLSGMHADDGQRMMSVDALSRYYWRRNFRT